MPLSCVYSEGAVTKFDIAKRIATFPPLIALVVAVALIPLSYPPLVTSVLARLGGTLAPLALVSVGLQLRLGELSGNCSLLANPYAGSPPLGCCCHEQSE